MILAGITISLALGQNGIFKRALQAKQATRISEVKEEVQKWLLNNETNEQLGYKESIVSTEDFLKELKDKGKITEDEYNKAIQGAKLDNPKLVINNGKKDFEIPLKRQDGTGSNEQGKETPSTPTVVDNKSIKRGDIIKYDPTRDVTDESLLSYKSPKGDTSKTTPEYGGNGEWDRTITASSTHDEWQVLKNDAGKITLVLKEPTNKLALRGGQGWLYAEREIHKGCSIYGYGKGADKSQITKYTIGNPYIEGEAIEEKITGSGARSITLEDLEELGNIDDEMKKRLVKEHVYQYGVKGSKVLKAWVDVPTINSTDPKKSKQINGVGLAVTDYRIPNSNNDKNVIDIFGELNDLVFPSKENTGYFIASRTIGLYSYPEEYDQAKGYQEHVYCNIVSAKVKEITGEVCFMHSMLQQRANYGTYAPPEYFTKESSSFNCLRPVVTLSRDVELIPDGEIDGKPAYRIK